MRRASKKYEERNIIEPKPTFCACGNYIESGASVCSDCIYESEVKGEKFEIKRVPFTLRVRDGDYCVTCKWDEIPYVHDLSWDCSNPQGRAIFGTERSKVGVCSIMLCLLSKRFGSDYALVVCTFGRGEYPFRFIYRKRGI